MYTYRYKFIFCTLLRVSCINDEPHQYQIYKAIKHVQGTFYYGMFKAAFQCVRIRSRISASVSKKWLIGPFFQHADDIRTSFGKISLWDYKFLTCAFFYCYYLWPLNSINMNYISTQFCLYGVMVFVLI